MIIPAQVTTIFPSEHTGVWVADLRYMRSERRLAFLAVLLQGLSYKIVGPTMDARFPWVGLEAPVGLIWSPAGCLHQSDRNSQYAQLGHHERPPDPSPLCSMSRTSNL